MSYVFSAKRVRGNPKSHPGQTNVRALYLYVCSKTHKKTWAVKYWKEGITTPQHFEPNTKPRCSSTPTLLLRRGFESKGDACVWQTNHQTSQANLSKLVLKYSTENAPPARAEEKFVGKTNQRRRSTSTSTSSVLSKPPRWRSGSDTHNNVSLPT